MDIHESVDEVLKSGKDITALQVLVVCNICLESAFNSKLWKENFCFVDRVS